MPRKLSSRTRIAPTAAVGSNVPHSWPVSLWPTSVHPCDPQKAKWLVRSHERELLQAGALARIGRERVIFGTAYVRWMTKQAKRVVGFEIAPNRRAEAAPEPGP